MAGVTGKQRTNEEEGKHWWHGGGQDSDPLTHNAARVEMGGTNNHAKSRAITHIHTHTVYSAEALGAKKEDKLYGKGKAKHDLSGHA